MVYSVSERERMDVWFAALDQSDNELARKAQHTIEMKLDIVLTVLNDGDFELIIPSFQEFIKVYYVDLKRNMENFETCLNGLLFTVKTIWG